MPWVVFIDSGARELQRQMACADEDEELVTKRLDPFELECVLTYIGQAVAADAASLDTDAHEKLLRSRVRRFVLTHPDLTAKHRHVFHVAMKRPVR